MRPRASRNDGDAGLPVVRSVKVFGRLPATSPPVCTGHPRRGLPVRHPLLESGFLVLEHDMGNLIHERERLEVWPYSSDWLYCRCEGCRKRFLNAGCIGLQAWSSMAWSGRLRSSRGTHHSRWQWRASQRSLLVRPVHEAEIGRRTQSARLRVFRAQSAPRRSDGQEVQDGRGSALSQRASERPCGPNCREDGARARTHALTRPAPPIFPSPPCDVRARA